jgi:hypothetical protein
MKIDQLKSVVNKVFPEAEVKILTAVVPNSCVTLQFEDGDLLGNLCLWSNGTLDMLVLDTEKGSEVVNKPNYKTSLWGVKNTLDNLKKGEKNG